MGRYALAGLFAMGAMFTLWAAACSPAPPPSTPLMQAFNRYEAIRVSLSGDSLDAVGEQATELVPLAGQVAGEEAAAAASRLAAAETVAGARFEFISVSSELVPKFLEAELPEVHGFMCPARDHGNLIWAQRSDEIQNPYFGSVMLDCGSEIQAPE